MSTLTTLQKKRTKLIVGLISGTSADGIDAALARVTGNGTSTRIKQVAFDSYPYPAGFSSDAKEAICFAILANETISEHPANVPSVTGARRAVVLGKICL